MSSEAARFARILRNNTPWGPFWDSEALTEKCKSTPKRPLELDNVYFAVRKNGEKYNCVGLDLTEAVAILPGNAKAEEENASSRLRPLSVRNYPKLSGGEAGRVYFRGDFTVMREDQLTPECLDYIVDKLCELMKRERSAILNYLFPKPPLAYRERFPLVIRVQAWKKLPVVPQSQRDEARVVFILDLISVNRERHYSVMSLESHTYELSRVYLARHHCLLTMKNIMDLHPVPVWLRTPKWFVARYLDLYRRCEGSRWGRLLGIPDRGQRQPGAPEPGEFVIGTPTNQPRHLRISKREVASMLGSHVEWIILQYHCSHKPLIDIPSWLDFAESTFRARRADPSVARRDDYSGHISATQRYEVEVRRLVRCRNKTYPAPGVPEDDEPIDENAGRDVPSSSSDSDSSTTGSDSGSEPEGRGGNLFAGNFDDVHIPPEDDYHPGPRRSNDRDTWREPSASTSSHRRAPPRLPFKVVQRSRLDALTRHMIVEPSLDTRLQWHCPGCNECFDVMDITNTQRQLYAPDVYYESNGHFIIRNERRNEALRRFWRSHGSRHLKERGVSLDASHPSNQPSRGPVRRQSRPLTPKGDEGQTPDVHEGDQSDVEMEDVGGRATADTDRLSDDLAVNTQRSLTLTSDNAGGFEHEHHEPAREPSLPENSSDDEENPFATEAFLNWSCPFRPCGQSFLQEALLVAHFSLAHGQESAIKCTIPRCKTYVRMEEELRIHLKAHEASKDNGISTARRSRPSRKRAGNNHTPLPAPQADERTFGCPVPGCDKEYPNLWNRTRHITRDHPDITTYECGDNLHGSRKKCAAMFLTQRDYRVHVIQDHGSE